MENNEIKKELYKQKPKATFLYIQNGVAVYTTLIIDFEDSGIFIKFEIPVTDMGEAKFEALMDAKLLIRWLVK
jgi:hypothetical protein